MLSQIENVKQPINNVKHHTRGYSSLNINHGVLISKYFGREARDEGKFFLKEGQKYLNPIKIKGQK